MSAGDHQEIERKFLVRDDSWRPDEPGTPIRQGYLCRSQRTTVRVRIEGHRGRLTIKGPTRGIRRTEFEYEIPLDEARTLLEGSCDGALIDKTRYRVPHEDHVWEVDEFHGDNAGLIVAEVELASEDDEPALPAWAGAEVSDDPRYLNACLAAHPYGDWADDER